MRATTPKGKEAGVPIFDKKQKRKKGGRERFFITNLGSRSYRGCARGGEAKVTKVSPAGGKERRGREEPRGRRFFPGGVRKRERMARAGPLKGISCGLSRRGRKRLRGPVEERGEGGIASLQKAVL